MRRVVKCLLAVAIFSLLPGPSWAQEGLIKSVKEGCEKELGSYCKEVTPGEGWVLACLPVCLPG
jgi:hypothetical protein